MTTLPEFIEIGRKHGRANLHIKVPGFHIFYARYGRRIINNVAHRDVLDIASVEVEERLRRTGVFTRLFHQLREDYPNVHIYVENAAPLFQKLLLRLGFRRHEFNPDSFYVLGDSNG